jgi:hypothetical protein
MQAKYLGLHTNQRNIYNFYLHHRKKYKGAPCYLPTFASFAMREKDFRRALETLEELKLISIDRSSPYPTQWILSDPK